MNHFFALPLPEEIRRELGKLAREWQSLPVGRASWYTPADYHVTLKFLGDLDPARQSDLIAAALPAAAATRPFEVDLNAPPGAFPNLHQPRVLWAGVTPSRLMADLAGAIDTATAALGFERERRALHPHITLARARQGAAARPPAKPAAWPAPRERGFPIFTADCFVLMQTSPLEKYGKTVENSGSLRYNIVRTFPLGVKD